jgi:hypothetical protein
MESLIIIIGFFLNAVGVLFLNYTGRSAKSGTFLYSEEELSGRLLKLDKRKQRLHTAGSALVILGAAIQLLHLVF